MANKSLIAQMDPAEGSREIIDRELARQDRNKRKKRKSSTPLDRPARNLRKTQTDKRR